MRKEAAIGAIKIKVGTNFFLLVFITISKYPTSNATPNKTKEMIIMSKRILDINVQKAYVACATLSSLNLYEMFTLVNVVLLGRYNGQKGKGGKWLFYLYYPLHLAIAAGVCMLVGLY